MRRLIAVIFVLLAIYIAYTFLDHFKTELVYGKHVLVTGASMGIGEQMVYHYAKMGAKLLITSRTEHKLQKVVERCKDIGDPAGQYNYISADMSIMNDSKTVIQEAANTLGGLDYLVLNHILYSSFGEWLGTPENMTLLNNMMDVNFHSYVHLASHALPLLEKSGGSIIVVSSVAGKLGMPYLGSYSASKFALDGFFSALRQELKIRGSSISVSLAVIGNIDTENAKVHTTNFGLSHLTTMKKEDPSETALAIIKGGALREREIYFPYLEARGITLFKEWIINILETSIRVIFQRD